MPNKFHKNQSVTEKMTVLLLDGFKRILLSMSDLFSANLTSEHAMPAGSARSSSTGTSLVGRCYEESI